MTYITVMLLLCGIAWIAFCLPLFFQKDESLVRRWNYNLKRDMLSRKFLAKYAIVAAAVAVPAVSLSAVLAALNIADARLAPYYEEQNRISLSQAAAQAAQELDKVKTQLKTTSRELETQMTSRLEYKTKLDQVQAALDRANRGIPEAERAELVEKAARFERLYSERQLELAANKKSLNEERMQRQAIEVKQRETTMEFERARAFVKRIKSELGETTDDATILKLRKFVELAQKPSAPLSVHFDTKTLNMTQPTKLTFILALERMSEGTGFEIRLPTGHWYSYMDVKPDADSERKLFFLGDFKMPNVTNMRLPLESAIQLPADKRYVRIIGEPDTSFLQKGEE